MPSVREIKRRIQSVKNITQVTRALEAVSASKARRAQQQAARSRPYTQGAWEVLVNLAAQSTINDHPLMKVPGTVKSIDMVLITSDRGLAGSYNQNIIRVAEEFVEKMGVPCRWITIGRKGRDYLIRRRKNVVAEFSHLPANLSLGDITPIGDLLVSDFLKDEAQQVFVAYTDFINVLAQRPAVVNLLPLRPWEQMVASDYYKPEPPQTVSDRIYTYEPDASQLLEVIVPRFTSLQIYQAVLEAAASEHAARMVAMRNATENGVALSEDLTLEYNKARQTAITAEILDIVGGVEALKNVDDKDSRKGNGAVAQADQFLAAMRYQMDEDRGDARQDDLTVIEGIGPKVQQALYSAGIRTFAQLAMTSAADLLRVVKDAGVRIVGDAATWAKQAQYLVNNDPDGLKAYQERLVGGREPGQ